MDDCGDGFSPQTPEGSSQLASAFSPRPIASLSFHLQQPRRSALPVRLQRMANASPSVESDSLPVSRSLHELVEKRPLTTIDLQLDLRAVLALTARSLANLRQGRLLGELDCERFSFRC